MDTDPAAESKRLPTENARSRQDIGESQRQVTKKLEAGLAQVKGELRGTGLPQEICGSFVGREQELREIAEFMKAEELKGLSLLGLPQIGRSTLLCEIEKRSDEHEYGANMCVVRIECKKSPDVIRWSDLLETIVQRVSTRFKRYDAVSQLADDYKEAVWGDLPRAETATKTDNQSSAKQHARETQASASAGLQGETNLTSTRDAPATPKTWCGFFEDLETTVPELRVVFLLDDFDQSKPYRRPGSKTQTEWVTGWHFAKFVAYSNVSLIATSTCHIQQIEHFFTHFTEQWLSPFTKKELDELVENNAFRPSARLKDDIWEWAGGFPGLGCELLERYSASSRFKVARNAWLRKDVEPWFNEVWDLLHPFERELLAILACKRRFLARGRGLKLRYSREKDVAEWLEGKGLVSIDGEWAQIAFEALRTSVLRKVVGKKWWHFTRETLFWLSIGSMLVSSVLIPILDFVEAEPALGALPMLFPLAYLIYGLFAAKYENA